MGPLPDGFLDRSRFASVTVTDRGGVVLYEALSDTGERSHWIPPEAIPPNVLAATIAAEDRRFFSHPGIDPLALSRAAWHDLVTGAVVEGGSTLTQQTVKQIEIAEGHVSTNEKSFSRKFHEIVLALRLEHRLSKREILAIYLNLAPYGNQFRGVDRASRGYFGIAPSELTLAQAAFLAGLPQRPSALDPYRNPSGALSRQRRVLSRIAVSDAVTPEALRAAQEEHLRFVRRDRPFLAPHLVQETLAKYTDPGVRRIVTTIDAPLQERVAGIIAARQKDLQRHGAANVAVVVLDNASGEWLAWEGSGDYFDAEHGGAIDGASTPRQPGSALKPFTYAAAFERGESPASLLPDVPQHFPTAVGGVNYVPRNYDGVFRGPLRARQALAGSENVPAVWLLSKVGVPTLLRLLRSCGVSTLDRTPDYYGLGLTLGDAEVRLDELVAAYATFARGGIPVVPRSVKRVVGIDGQESTPPKAGSGERTVSARTAFWITDVLSDSDARRFIFGEGGSLDFPFPVAVKTGTSQAYRDNWTIGYTREVTVGVWVGNFDRTPLRGSSGVTGAAPIFHAVMLAAEERVLGRFPTVTDPPIVPVPTAVVLRPVCALTGMQPGPFCPSTRQEWVATDVPVETCTWHSSRGVLWPAEYRAWAAERGTADVPVVRAQLAARHPAVHITNPPPGATYLIDPTLRSEFQTLSFRATANGRSGMVTWRVDGRTVGTASSESSVRWPIRAGKHRVEAIVEGAHADAVEITVK
ncbi:MAG: penicillin-binding protein 1C [Thermoanaerobaculia bacterium]